jgi:hypothetical protein
MTLHDRKGENITRQTIPRDPENPVDHLSTGYPEQPETPPVDFHIPSCGIVDFDSSVKRLFSKDLPFAMKQVSGENGAIYLKKPAVIFASGERFALIKRLRPVRDKNGALILPAISIRNIGLEQSYDIMSSRGMNQTTGEIVVKRRLDASDGDYQNFINKLGIKNRPYDGSSTGKVTGQNANDSSIQQGMLLDGKNDYNNIWEILVIPQPQFVICTYEVVFWTTHMEHMNYMVETLLSSQLPQVKGFRLAAENGYWFIGYLEDQIEPKDNFDDFTEEKKIVRKSFSLKVHGYILAPNGSNRMTPIKRYISAPMVTFDVQEGEIISKKDLERLEERIDPFALTNIEDETANPQTPTVMERFMLKKNIYNPTTRTTEETYVRIDERNPRETVYTASDPATLEQFFFPPKKSR